MTPMRAEMELAGIPCGRDAGGFWFLLCDESVEIARGYPVALECYPGGTAFVRNA